MLRDLKQHKYIILTALEVRSSRWVTLGYNLGVGRSTFLQRLQGRMSPCLFQLLGATHISGLVALSPSSKPAAWDLQISLTFLPPFYRNTWGLYWTHLNNPRYSLHLKILNLITYAKSLLPCKVNSQVPGTGTWPSWGCGRSLFIEPQRDTKVFLKYISDMFGNSGWLLKNF